MNKKLILILCEPRTGSNLLHESFLRYNVRGVNEFFLNVDGNYLSHDKVPKKLPHRRLIRKSERRQLANFLNINENNYPGLVTAINDNPIPSLLKLSKVITKTLVVKIHHHQFEKLNLKSLLALDNVEVILLERTSKLHSFVSLTKAKQLRQWHNVDTNGIKINLDINEFNQYKNYSLQWYNETRAILNSLNKKYLEVNYEQDLEDIDNSKLYNKLDSWFEIINFRPKLRLHHGKEYRFKYFKKQNLKPIEDSIENYNDIVNDLCR